MSHPVIAWVLLRTRLSVLKRMLRDFSERSGIDLRIWTEILVKSWEKILLGKGQRGKLQRGRSQWQSVVSLLN
jgi:hypothetical protein